MLSSEGEWRSAGSFCIEISAELRELFGLDILDERITRRLTTNVLCERLNRRTREAFGVRERLDIDTIVNQIKESAGIDTPNQPNPDELLDILEVLVSSQQSWSDET